MGLVGSTGDEQQTLSWADLAEKEYALMGLHWGLYRSKDPHAVQAAHGFLSVLAQQGRVRPWVTSVRSFEDAPRALDDVYAGRTLGRVVLRGWGAGAGQGNPAH